MIDISKIQRSTVAIAAALALEDAAATLRAAAPGMAPGKASEALKKMDTSLQNACDLVTGIGLADITGALIVGPGGVDLLRRAIEEEAKAAPNGDARNGGPVTK